MADKLFQGFQSKMKTVDTAVTFFKVAVLPLSSPTSDHNMEQSLGTNG